MKVLCVTNDYKGPWSSFSAKKWLKIGEWYKVEDHGDNCSYYTCFFDNKNSPANLAKEYFKTPDQLRHEKLEYLGI